jgi:glycosyltransferase involved in cell wall biosynthesis
MKIVQINTYDIQGGAARAAYRLHKGLRQIGMDCRMLVRYKESKDDSVLRIAPIHTDENVHKEFLLSTVIQWHYINSNRTDISNTLFSLPYPGYDIAKLHLVQQADIINLHWVAYNQSPITLHNLFALGKPVVWTLHDQWALTGGCHYSATCEKYRQDCSACPQLSDDPFNLVASLLKDKLELFRNANLTIVTPSKWLAKCAKVSTLFKDSRIEVIPNAIEIDIFEPINKPDAKKSLGLATDTITLLFGAEYSSEKRKGFRELVAAIQYCKADKEFQRLLNNDKFRIICLGHPNKELEAIDLPIAYMGYIDSDENLRVIYSASDIFVLPSLEDNLPNTMLESLSCGTPVVAFAVGGIPDVVVPGVTGQLAPVYDVHKLGEAILSLIFNPDQREEMGQKGRKEMLDNYSLDIQAGHYLSLYKGLQTYRLSQVVSNNVESTIEPLENQALASTDIPVPIETGIGPHFENIYDLVLSKALKEFAPLGICFESGFYNDEGGWRWMNQKGNILISKSALSKPSIISFELTNDRAEYYDHFPFDVRIYVNNELKQKFIFNSSEQTEVIQLRINKIDSDAHIFIENGELFIPSQLGISNDSRQLAVRFSNLHIEPIDS